MDEHQLMARELRQQAAELAATRALEAERQRYQELFELVPVAYLVTDPLARVSEANRAAAALLDVEQRFLTGKPLAAYVASGDRWGFRSMVNWLARDDGHRVTDRPLRLRRRCGQVVAATVTVEQVWDRGGGLRALRWLLRDLAPDRQGPRFELPMELTVERDDARRRHLDVLADLDPAVDLDGAVQVLLDVGVRLLDVDGIGLMLADGHGRLCAAGGSDEASSSYLRAQEFLVNGPCVQASLLERPVHSGRLAGDARWPQLAVAATVNGIGAVLAAPIGLYGGPIGACLLVSSVPRVWTDGDLRAAEDYACVLAALLEVAAAAQCSTALSHQLQDLLRRRHGHRP
jgi:PAS domain S-box-containing protein